ncbi:MAG: hypothetical protein JSW00_19545 [Thermoplasmata archaeon]|nr:MAG: hypothetical protein JSW00_19545 [Thermoplasmata archaeon]
MPTSREILESTYRLGRMKNVRTMVYISHIMLTTILLIIMAFMTPDAGSYALIIRLEYVVFIIAIMILMVNVESFFFKSFGIKWAKTDSEKFLMSKDYMKKGIAIIIMAVAIIAFMNIMTPTTAENINTKEVVIVDDEYNTTFWPRDAFGASNLKRVNLESDVSNLDIFILEKDAFDSGYFGKRLNMKEEQSKNISSLNFEVEDTISQEEYVLFIDAKGNIAHVTYELEREVSTSLVWYLTIFPILFIVANAIFTVYLVPMRKRYEKTSIYE